jgi:hypothetical protein
MGEKHKPASGMTHTDIRLFFSVPPLCSLCLLRNSLRYLCILGVSAVEKCARSLPQRRRERRGSAEKQFQIVYLLLSEKQEALW